MVNESMNIPCSKIHLYLYCFWPLCRYTASHGILACLVGTSNVWDTFSSILPNLRVSSADSEKDCSVTWDAAELLCCPGQSQTFKVFRPPACRIRTMTSTCCFTPFPLPQDLNGEMRWDMQRTCVESFWSGNSVALGQSHSLRPQITGLVVWRFIMTGGFLGCSRWLWHLEGLVMPYVFYKALQNHFPGHWTYWWSHLPSLLEVTSHTGINKLHSSLDAWEPLANLTQFGHPVKAIAQGMATAACKQLVGNYMWDLDAGADQWQMRHSKRSVTSPTLEVQPVPCNPIHPCTYYFVTYYFA